MSFFSVDCGAQVLPSDIDYPYNHLPWYTIEGEHFMVHYQEGSEASAGAASLIARQIYAPVTDLYNYKPKKKVSIVLRDREDYSNGAAYFFDDKIEIWIPSLDTPFRGTHQWLQNVITHEFTHIVQMGASMKRSPAIQSVYLQWLSYEDVRRPDVLYGSPNGIISHPFSTVSIPAWFSEGTAQYMRDHIFYDFWDSHRDMLLRMAILNNNFLDFEDMGDFNSKNSLGREMVYNQGFDFVRYLTSRFGERIIAEFAQHSADGPNNFNQVMKVVTGFSGKQLFDDWIVDRKKKYADQTGILGDSDTILIEENGFMNFYPQFNRKGDIFGYLTNRGRDYSTTQLILKTADSTITVDRLGKPVLQDSNQHHLSAETHSDITINYVGNKFSISPDGEKVAYSKANKNRYGERYQDIYLFDIEKEKKYKVTTDARIQDPAWHPSGKEIIATELRDGTQNIILINPDTNEQSQMTNFKNGETVYAPVWSFDGRYIYFSAGDGNNRNIYQYNFESGQVIPLFNTERIDFRDPWADPAGEYLYFSADVGGIFNIYREKMKTGSIQKITSVQGGAFMPFATENLLYFSEYKKDGYKISAISLPDFKETDRSDDFAHSGARESGSRVSDHALSENSAYKEAKNFSTIHDSLRLDNTRHVIQISGNPSDNESYTWQPYRQTTTGLSLIPVIRFDNYSKLKGSNSRLIRDGKFGNAGKNLVRDFKAGAYFSSRDVTERLSLFAGALFGWGSLEADNLSNFFSPNRLNNLDRDLFFIVEHRGIPFIRRSWSPTIGIEVYNLKRNVRDGVSIEEFPCTSCFPVQKSIDVRYNVWEANLFLRSKLNRWSLLEFGASYSPYSVATEGFFSEEFKEYVPGSTTEYFKGSSYSASYIANSIVQARHADIAPEGLFSTTTFSVENGRLLQEFEIDEGLLSPIYSKKTNYSLELKNQLGAVILGDLNGMFTTRAFTYFNNPEDYFYLDYAGGLTGMRSYPYFAVGGQRTVWGRFSLLAPIKKNINKHIGPYTFDKLYAHLFFEMGNGWGGPLNIGSEVKTGLGTELRFALNSYYLFPIKIFVNTTYGFNRFNVTLPDQFITTSSENSISYGKEVLFYFGLTFDFNQL